MIHHKIYLPMSTREAGYCVTNVEQKWLARSHGMTVDRVREVLLALAPVMTPVKSATQAKRLIAEALKSHG